MKSKFLSLTLFVLIAATLACSVNINLPNTQLKTGPTITDDINIPIPDTKNLDINFSIGGGKFNLRPGAKDELVTGTVTYNVEDFKPEIEVIDGNISMIQGNLNLREGIPTFDKDIKNEWNLVLANVPMTIRIKAGAYQGNYEFGGLSIENLYIEDGASSVELNFSTPNQTEMGILSYQTGASSVKLYNLGNANMSTLIFRSGLGDYTLDFSGDMQRDTNVTIGSGLSNVILIIPESLSTRVRVDSGLTNVSTRGDWSKNGDNYSATGTGPSLSITIDIGAGNLELRH